MRVGKIGESLLTKVRPCCSPHQHSAVERLKMRLKSNLKMDTQLAHFQASNSYGNKSNWLFSLLLIQLLAFSEIWTDSFNHVSRCKVVRILVCFQLFLSPLWCTCMIISTKVVGVPNPPALALQVRRGTCLTPKVLLEYHCPMITIPSIHSNPIPLFALRPRRHNMPLEILGLTGMS